MEKFNSIIIVFIFILLFSSFPIGYAKYPAENMKFGVNYLSTHWHYEPYYLSDEELDRDFELFSKQELEYVSLVAVWKYLEPSPGVYNDGAFNDLLRVCKFADKYKLKVIIDFHTLMHENSFTMPEWLYPRKFETVFFDDTSRQAWLNFLDYSISYLSSAKNIHSWQMMNEPALNEWACDVTIEEFINLWTQMRNVIKDNSDKPVSIRFGANTFDAHFERDPRIFQICDYVSLNWYEEYCTREKLVDIVNDIREYCPVTISEFGFKTDDDIIQLEAYYSMIELFKSLKIKTCVAWIWRADYDLGNPAQPGFGYNLAKNVGGDPRPAFYLLGNSINSNMFRWFFQTLTRMFFTFFNTNLPLFH